MRPYRGSNADTIKDPQIRDHARAVDDALFNLNSAIAKLAEGQTPDGSATIISSSGVTDHGALTGLGDDDHSGYLWLAGRAGGQTLYGGTAAFEDLTLKSTSNATLGSIFFGATGNHQFLESGGSGAGCWALNTSSFGTNAALTIKGLNSATSGGAAVVITPGAGGGVNAMLSCVGTNSGQFLINQLGNVTHKLGTADTGTVPYVLRRCAAGATANLFEWQDESNNVLAYVDKDGNASFAGMTLPSATLTLLTLEGADPGAYDGASGLLFNNSTDGFNVQVVVNPGQTADRILRLPSDADGILITTTGTQTISAKTLNTTNTLRASTSSSGAAFEDNSTTSKKLRFVLSGAVGNNAISVSSTAARTYTLPDKTGTALIRSTVGTTRSVFIPASSFYDVVAAGFNLAASGTFPDAYLAIPMLGVGGTTQVVTSFQIPQDWLSGATWKVHYTNGGSSTNATWWRIKYLSASAGDTLTAAGTDNTGTSTPSATTHALNITTIGTSSTGIAAGETVRLCVERDSGNASDTNTSTMNFVGVSFEYTADI